MFYDAKDVSITLQSSGEMPDYAAALQGGVKGMRIGIPKQYYFEAVDVEVEQAVRAAIDVLCELGAETVEVSLPMMKYAPGAEWAICLSETAAIHDEWIRARPDDYAPDVRLMIEAGKHIPAASYLQAQRVRHLIHQDFMAAFSHVDVLVTPTLPHVAPRIGYQDEALNIARFTFPTDVTGMPSLSLPCGFSSDGLPIGLQLIGRPFAEATVLCAGYAYEQATAWHTHHPTF